MDKAGVVEILEEIALLLELKGENPFKSRAYVKAARTLETLEGDLTQLVAEKKLGEIPGIGAALQQKITEAVTTGRLIYYEDLQASFPPGVRELLEIPGVGPKKVRLLHEQLGICSVEELEKACAAQQVRGLAGFGEKTEQKILQGIAQNRTYAKQYLYPASWARAEMIREALREHEAVSQVSIAGSLRRGKEIVKDVDIVVSSRNPAAVMAYFVTLPGVASVVQQGETKASVLLEGGQAADLRVVSEVEFPYALHHFTGSKEHNVRLRQRAISQGKKLSEWGLFEMKPDGEEGARIPCATEEELFTALGLAYIPPELREDLGEVEVAEKNQVPRLIKWTELRGTFHCHTHASDGQNSLLEMAEEAQELGLQYLGIADHSKSSVQANGLDENRLAAQIEQIAQLNKKLPSLHLFSGSEVDILKDGRLDFTDDILAQLDYVVASVHNPMSQTEEERTRRVIRAMENEYVTMLGHATGRLLLAREPYQIDLEKILDCAAATGTWIELNCSAMRMDLDWRWWRRAREKGVKCVINPDAHKLEHYGMLRHGTTLARKAWLGPDDVMNTLPLEKMQAALKAFGRNQPR